MAESFGAAPPMAKGSFHELPARTCGIALYCARRGVWCPTSGNEQPLRPILGGPTGLRNPPTAGPALSRPGLFPPLESAQRPQLSGPVRAQEYSTPHLCREADPEGSLPARENPFLPQSESRSRGGRRLFVGRPRTVGRRAPGHGAASARRSREEGKTEARLLGRIVIFHQSAAICVSAPDRTPAVLLAGVTETTQRWRRANCICSPAHRSKLRPSHGAGKGAKGPCDMREI